MPTGNSKAIGEIRQLHHHKSRNTTVGNPLGPELIDFFKQSVTRRQTKLVKVAESWSSLIPRLLNEHCALESFSRGTLTVMVDSSSHLYELKQVLLSGLEKQLLFACKAAGLRKIVLRPGRWYDGDSSEDRRVRFRR
jgi:Dna[CI] antecedent DciA-like protein